MNIRPALAEERPQGAVKQMRCLVTGGCGFIGSHLVDRLLESGHQVTILDDLSAGSQETLNPDANLVEGSITDMHLLDSASEGVNWIFHTAAWARIQRSIDDPIGTHNVNVTGTLNVLDVARMNKVERVIYSSSSSVYGDQASHIMHEEMVPAPKSPYAVQKLIGEQYCTLYAHIYGMKVCSLRYFNVYGPGQPREGAYVLVIPDFLRLRAEQKPMTVYGDGNQTRSYTHVSDVANANLLAAAADLPSGENTILNIGTDVETSVNEIAAIIGGETEHIIPNPRGEFEELRKCADYSKSAAKIGWQPQTQLRDGIAALL